MVCRNCGLEIPEGKLYCPFCGEEVQLVPEYSSVDMQRARKRMEEEEQERLRLLEEQEAKERERSNRIGPGMILLAVLIGLLFAGGLSVGARWLIDRNNRSNYGYLKQAAAASYEEGNGEEALQLITRAEALMPASSVELPLLKSDVLLLLGRRDDAKAILFDLLTRSEETAVYDKLIASLAEDGENERIAELVEASHLPALKETYAAFLSAPPEFSLMNGNTYAYGTMLTISAEGAGQIYYTLDGTEPDDTSILYTDSITLEVGTNRIRAIFINEKGVRSKAAAAVYNVRRADPKAA